jgi:predicted metal-dependent peptidase
MEAEARRTGGPVPAFEPGLLRRSERPRVVVGLDASSSIDEARLAMFLGEIAGIVRRMAAELWVIPFDEAAREAVPIDHARWRGQLAALEVPRGGGTSFAPVIAAAARLGPSVIVVLTDLEGEAGPAPRGVPVVWAVPDGAPPTPPFGRVLSLAR